MRSTTTKLAVFTLSTLFFGTQFVGIRAAVGPVPPATYAALRFDIGVLFLLTLTDLTNQRLSPQTKNDLYGIGTFGVFIVALENLLLFSRQETVAAGLTAVLFSFMAIFAQFSRLFCCQTSDSHGWGGLA